MARVPPMKRLAVACLFLVQIVSVVRARYVPTRWFSWAPNDYAVGYDLHVRMDGRNLSAVEIGDRYSIPAAGVYENPAENLIEIVQERERTYGRNDHADVVLDYRPNGGPQQEWRWPQR